MTEEGLNLQPGTFLQLQAAYPENAPRHRVQVIGYLRNASLVVTTPTSRGRVLIVREDTRYNVRMLRGNAICGFVSRVLQSAAKPFPHLHLEYPKEVEFIVVRNARRVDADLPAKVRNTDSQQGPAEDIDARLTDLSASGARIDCDRVLGEIGDSVALTFEIAVAEQADRLHLIAEIRNIFERTEGTGPRMLHGVCFQGLNRFQQVLLHGWVMEHFMDTDLPSTASVA